MHFVNAIGYFFFKYRDKLPVPLVLSMLCCAKPDKKSWKIGLPFILAGQLLRLWSLMHIGPTTRTREVSANRLVTSGPYSFCRNPLYLANLTKVTGLLIITKRLYFSFFALLFYFLEFFFMIPFEENFLSEKFPEEHKEYTKDVPVFLPSLKASKKYNSPANFTCKEAIRSERKTFLSTGIILLFLSFVTFYKRRQE